MIGFEEVCEGLTDQINRGRIEVHSIARSGKTLPVARDGVGLAIASEEGFEDSVTNQKAVIGRREPDFFDREQGVIPPDDHGINLGAIGGKPSGMRQKMRLRDFATKLSEGMGWVD